ncbi:Alpha-ribazole phosphatase [Arthrobacter saudimassiliensis]|uniref:Alpha-ribazole phosphatase n=1 Tax=Arthrobacter saudimassiliensis TaxID=1461584 RepID=A0A078MU10_9MICC|nr:Alpha-ribazole phosphatase [Arthrobacter saudimassiliensis]
MRLTLVRHGQTPSNVRRLLDTGAPGPGLTDLGREQARAVPAALGQESVDGLFASNLVRTQHTAAPLARERDLPVEIDPRLREISAGSLEMRGDDAAVRTYLETVYAWVSGDLQARMPSGPDGAETLGRFDEAVDRMLRAGLRSPVVFSHGAIIRAWSTARAANVAPDFITANPLSNTGIVVLEHGGSGWELLTWMGEAVGGRTLQDAGEDGPAAEGLAS